MSAKQTSARKPEQTQTIDRTLVVALGHRFSFMTRRGGSSPIILVGAGVDKM